MRIRRAALFALLSLALCGFAAGQSTLITFALPDLEGVITLGVFDSQGHLVRTLCRNAAVGSFIIGLNGLITKWDGNDDGGKHLPPGTYDVRGYVVGPVGVEGVDSLFNDWIDDDPALQVENVEGLKLLNGGDLIVLASVAGAAGIETEMFRTHPDGTQVWRISLPAEPLVSAHPASGGGTVLGAGEDFACIWRDGKLAIFNSTSGTPVKNAPLDAADAESACCDGNTLNLCEDNGLATADLPDLKKVSFQPVPAKFTAIDADDGWLGGAGDTVWLRKDGVWTRTPVAHLGGIRGFSMGVPGAFWITGDQWDNSGAFAGEFSFDGKFLRQLRADAGYVPGIVSASHITEEIALLENSASGQRVRILKQDEGASAGGWKVIFQRAATRCGDFGVINGKLLPDVAGPPQTDLKFRLSENELTGGKHAILALHAAFDATGSWLETSDGLRLVQVSESPGIRRVALMRGNNPDTVRFFQGNGATVDEYEIINLRQIAGIEAGTMELK